MSTLPPPPRPATLRARPLLFVTAFALVHQAIASGALVPAYAFFAGGDASTALLAGPVAARVLRQNVPFSSENRTVADLVEDAVRGGVRTGFGMFTTWRQRRAEPVDEAAPPPGTLRRMVARARGTREQMAHAHIADSTIDELEGNQSWKGRLADGAARVRLKHVTDAAAAYLVVKALFPLRLGLSLFLAPRLARAFARRWP